MKACLPLLFLFIAAATGFAQTTVSRTPPAVYEKHLKGLITPWTALGDPAASVTKEHQNAIETLVHEEFIWVEEGTGLVTLASHKVHKALTSEGAELMEESSYPFGAKSERLHMALARSSQDGKVFKDVVPEGLFIKRPESSGDDSVMHTDTETLNVVFPDVRAGSFVEEIVVSEETENQSAGHFLRQAMWGGVGRVHLRRIVVNLPASMEKALKWKAVGTLLEEPKRSDLPGGRVMLEWTSRGLPPMLFEDRGPPASQAGPMLRMSTMDGWEGLGKWFADSVTEMGDLTPEQKESVSRLVAGLKSDREKAAKVFEHVSQDIRYTALEFGRGRYQPRAPAMVAETRYGDCKDKANVLRLMLKHLNIESRLALLETKHSGVIDHSIPSPGRFNHAILAVTLPGKDGKAEVVFCDPTIDGVPLDVLSTSDADRETLVVSELGEIEWLRTPKQDFVTHVAEVDLVPEPGGGVSGWIKIRMDDYYGHVTRRRWTRQGTDGKLAIAKDMVSSQQGQDLIDVQEEKPTKSHAEPFQISTYVLRTGAEVTEGEATERVRFPALGLLLPVMGKTAIRQTDALSTPLQMKVTGGYQVPKGWRLLDMPAAFAKEVAGCVMKASWKEKKGGLQCQCEMRMTQSVIPASQHQALWQARRDFAEWLSTPALLKRTGVTMVTAANGDEEKARVRSADPARLPKMPTVKGQTLLLERRFPLNMQDPTDGDHDARRIAAKLMLKQFPNNPGARFEAEMRLIWCDMIEGGDLSELTKRIEPLLADTGDELKPEQVAQGRIMLAGALIESGKNAEGRALAAVSYKDERIPLPFRQLAAGVIALCDDKDDPASAFKMAREALAAKMLPEMSRLPIFDVFVRALAWKPEMTATQMQQELKSSLQGKTEEEAEAMWEVVLEAPETLVETNQLSGAEKLLAAVRLIAKADAWDEVKLDALEYAETSVKDARAFEPVHKQILAWLAKNPWPEAEKLEKDDVIEDAAASGEIAGDYYDRSDIRLRYLLRALTHYGPQPEGGVMISDVVVTANGWLAEPEEVKPPAQTEALIDELIRIWASFSADKEAEWNSEVFRGQAIQRREGPEKALVHYQAMLARPHLDAEHWIEASDRICDQYDELKNNPKLLEVLESCRRWTESNRAADRVLDGAHLALSMGDRKAAWRCLDWIAAQKNLDPDDYVLPKEAIAAIQSMSADHAGTELWWDRSAKWWAEWEKLAKSADLAHPKDVIQMKSQPWLRTHNLEKDADGYVKAKNKDMMLRTLHGVLLGARHYPFMGSEVAKFLKKQAVQVFPKHRDAFNKLATVIQP
ncbi:MAG: DUF3857 domain-containing protein [Verrucomicrobiota bacterium]